jgi:hypothetical protein
MRDRERERGFITIAKKRFHELHDQLEGNRPLLIDDRVEYWITTSQSV